MDKLLSRDFRIIFEVDGFPRELTSIAECVAAIKAGELTAHTEVLLYLPDAPVRSTQAAQVDELESLFRPSEPAPAPGPAARAPPRKEPARNAPFDEATAKHPELASSAAVSPDRVDLWEESPHWQEPVSGFGQGYQTSVVPKVVSGVILLIAMALGGVWLFSTPSIDQTSAKSEYFAIRTTNLRSEPSTGASVEGRLYRGDHVTATLVTTSDPALWVEVIGGPHAGRFAWLKNLDAAKRAGESQSR